MKNTPNYASNNSCTVMLSGGLKSVACYLYARETYQKVYPVIVCYNQINSSEVRHAVSWAKAMGDAPRIISLSHFSDYHGKIPFIAGRGPRPLNKSDLEKISSWEERSPVPGLDMALLAAAASYAHVIGTPKVLTGHWGEGKERTCEEVSTFLQAATACINSGISFSSQISILAPYLYMDLDQLRDFIEPYKERARESHSCIYEVEGGCKKCKKCLVREILLK